MKIWGTYLGLLLKAQMLNSKTKQKPKKQKLEFWKISEWDEDLSAYVVKHCSLTKEKADALNELFTRQGRYVKISPHFEKKRKTRRRKAR